MLPRQARHLTAGFTLVEMLVTLVLVALITGLLWQVMQQIARIERLLLNSGNVAQRELVRREWVRELIASAEPALQGDTSSHFRGDGSSVSLSSGAVTDLPGIAPGPVRLSLVRDGATNLNRLTIEPGAAESADSLSRSKQVVVLQWTGAAGRFQYLDEKGEWHSHWPLARPPRATGDLSYDPLLGRPPRLLRIDIGEDAGGVLLAAVGTTEAPRSRLVDWEKQ